MFRESRVLRQFGVVAGIALCLLPPAAGWACEVSSPQWLRFFASYERNLTASYAQSESATQVRNCKPGKKFLMIGIAPDHLTKGFARVGTYDGKLGDDRCRVLGSTLKSPDEPFADTAAFYSLRTDFIKECVVTTVQDMAGTTLSFPAAQPGCTITRLAPNRAQFSGTFCFFQPSTLSHYEITHSLRAECADRGFLASRGIRPMDVPATIGYFTAGDSTGHSTDLQAKKVIPARFSVDPGKELFEVTEDLGEGLPRWPAIWAPEVRFGGVAFRKAASEMLEVGISVLADNHCSSVCSQGLCSSPCDYSSPVAFEATLSEVKPGGKAEYIDSWMAGGAMLPRWQGLLSSAPRYIEAQTLKVGSAYRLDLILKDPYEDYYALVTTVDQFLISLSGMKGRVVGLEQLPSLGGLTPFRPLPALQGMTGLDRGGDPTTRGESLLEILNGMSRFLRDMQWPPYLTQVCDKDLARCTSPRKKFLYRFRVDFSVLSETATEYNLSPLQVTSGSFEGATDTLLMPEPARVVCDQDR